MAILPKIDFKNDILKINENAYKFKGFNFLELMPSGSNAIILKAKQPILKRVVIVKIWHKLRIEDLRDKKKQGMEEAVKLSQLEHENICRIFLVDTNKELFYAVLQYIEGQTLNLFLKETPAFNVRYNLWEQIASALLFSYQRGLYHGDLHDKNILICPDMTVKLLDFGTSYFAGKAFSENREKKMLISLTQQMFPDYEIKDFVEINLLKLTSFHVLRGLYYWVQIISAEFFSKKSAYQLSGVLISIANAPIFNISFLEKIVEFRKNRGTYVGILDSQIELVRNPDLKSSHSKIYNFAVMKKIYLEWRKEYLLKDITTIDTL